MRAIAFAAIAALFLSCGGQQETSAPEAAAPSGSAGGMSDVAGAASEALGVDPLVQDCLGLVADAKFAQAVPVCLQAVEAAPESQAAKDALARAQQQAASEALGATEAAGDAEELSGAVRGLMDD
jgi:hypothetical protein